MSRLFAGVSDEVQWAIGGCNHLGAWTFVSVIKLDAGVSWQSYLGNDHATTGSEIAMTRFNTGEITATYGGGAGGASKAISHSSADGWMLIAITKAAGVATSRSHKYPIGGSPTHTDGSETEGNPATQAGGKVVFGQCDGADFFKGRMAVCAQWDSALSDGDIESLVTGFTRANWVSLSPVGLWDELDVFQTDYGVGTATRTSLVGTADDADDPAGWANWEGAPWPPPGSEDAPETLRVVQSSARLA